MHVFAALRRFGTDRMAMTLSGLCLLHCIGGVVLFSVFAVIGEAFFDPIVHEIGLGLAIPLAILALGRGFTSHRKVTPLAIGAVGIGMMAAALSLPHGHKGEIALTVVGVSLVAAAHFLNRRALI